MLLPRRSVVLPAVLGLLICSSPLAAATVTLAWDPSDGSTGYVVAYGNRPGAYSFSVDVGNATVHTIDDLIEGRTYYFAVQARSAAGVSELSSPVALVVDPPPGLPPSNDLNGDSRLDLLWQNEADGALSTWIMYGTNLAAGMLLTPSRVADLGWKIVARGDFNDDGKPDLIWQHQTQGYISAWLMNGTSMMSSSLTTPGRVSDVNWKIVGSGDFNGDENPDLLWQHQSQGYLSVWLMHGLTVTDSILLTPGQVPDLNWKVVGVGDLDSNGRPDLVWHHQTTGYVSTWLMNGTRLVDARLTTPGIVPDLNWKIRAVGDVNSDGMDDLVWQHESQGWISTWLMNGDRSTGGVLMNPGRVADPNWKIAGPK